MRKALVALLSGILILQAISLVGAAGQDVAPPRDEGRAAVVEPTSGLPPVRTPTCPDPTPRNVVKVIRCLNANIARLTNWINKTFIRCTAVMSITRYGDWESGVHGYLYDPGDGSPVFNTSALDVSFDPEGPHFYVVVWKNVCQDA
jgi:hypothetical protein